MEEEKVIDIVEDPVGENPIEGDAVDVESEKTVRDRLYGRINVSVKTMDRFIIVLIAALALCVILGVLN